MTTTASDFETRLSGLHLVPLWRLADEILPPEPTPSAMPAHWSYPVVRSALFEAASRESGALPVADPDALERRVLLLMNPGLRGRVATTPTLVAGVQLLLPGETARAHRHTAAAVRFVIEGGGAHTVTDGERVQMEPGDLVLTPNWAWHDHGSEAAEPVLWLDGLDLPLVRHLQVGFFERFPQPRQPVTRRETPAALHYPWSVTDQALTARAEDGSQSDDMVTLDYTDPVTGGPVTPTIGCRAHLLRPGQTSRRRQETASAVLHVVRGEGVSVVGDTEVVWSEGDVFVVPGWAPVVHANRSGRVASVLVAITDEPALRALDLYRTA